MSKNIIKEIEESEMSFSEFIINEKKTKIENLEGEIKAIETEIINEKDRANIDKLEEERVKLKNELRLTVALDIDFDLGCLADNIDIIDIHNRNIKKLIIDLNNLEKQSNVLMETINSFIPVDHVVSHWTSSMKNSVDRYLKNTREVIEIVNRDELIKNFKNKYYFLKNKKNN